MADKFDRGDLAGRPWQEAKGFTGAVLDSMSDPVYAVDLRDYSITLANRAFLEAVGRTEREVIGQTCHGLTHQESAPCSGQGVACPLEEILRTGRSVTCEHVHGDRPETRRHMEVTISPLRDEHGKITHVVHVDRDLTERYRLEEQLRHSQKMEAVGHLAGGLAHDFNNLLTVIMGYGELLLVRMPLGDAGRPLADHLLAAAGRAAGLTRSLLAFSRKQVLNSRAVDLNEVVRQVDQLLRRLISEDIELRTIVASEPLITTADEGQIAQVLMNLMTNACDAMSVGGVLTLETRAIQLAATKTDGYQEVRPGTYGVTTVSDTGTGMDDAIRRSLFEPFFTTKEAGRGTGLGLAIVYGIVKQHNGVILVHSEPGVGSTFEIYLPLVTASPAAMPFDTQAQEALLRGTETILLAEDDPLVRDLARRILEAHGYRVVVATNGEEAVERFRETPDSVDLLLMDVLMPKMNGREAVEEIQGIRAGIRVVFMSGYTADVIRQRGQLDKALDVITKPMSPTELLRRVRAALDT